MNNNMKMVLKKIRWKFVDCIYMSQEKRQWRALVNTIMNLGVQ